MQALVAKQHCAAAAGYAVQAVSPVVRLVRRLLLHDRKAVGLIEPHARLVGRLQYQPFRSFR